MNRDEDEACLISDAGKSFVISDLLQRSQESGSNVRAAHLDDTVIGAVIRAQPQQQGCSIH